MRTLIIMSGGFVLWAVCLWTAILLSNSDGPSMTTVTLAFIVVWFVATAVTLWTGIAQASYSLREELPVFLLIFLLPAVVAILVWWTIL